VWTNWQTRHQDLKAKCTTYHNMHEVRQPLFCLFLRGGERIAQLADIALAQDNIWCMAGSDTTLASGAKGACVDGYIIALLLVSSLLTRVTRLLLL
jgi:hypothetical protein